MVDYLLRTLCGAFEGNRELPPGTSDAFANTKLGSLADVVTGKLDVRKAAESLAEDDIDDDDPAKYDG